MPGSWKRLQDWLTVVIGVLLFGAPFVLGATANQAAAWTAYAGGVLLAIAGLWSLTRSSQATMLPSRLRSSSASWCFSRPGPLASRALRRLPGARGLPAFSRSYSLVQSCSTSAIVRSSLASARNSYRFAAGPASRPDP
jgi:hypothetical protein